MARWHLLGGNSSSASVCKPTQYMMALICVSVLAMPLTGCGNAEKFNEVDATPASGRVELTLSKMQNQGVSYLSEYVKQQAEVVTALGRVKKAMEQYLFDPGTAKYSAIQVGRSGSVCGKYNAKNRYNAYVGFKDFVVTSDGQLFTSDANGGIDNSLTPTYIQAYLDSCASKAQIAAHKQNTPSYDYGSDNDFADVNEPEPDQEPDRILDAPSTPKHREKPREIPTA